MSFTLQPCSMPGQTVINAATDLIPYLREHGAKADRSNSMCESNIRALQDKGIAAAFFLKNSAAQVSIPCRIGWP